MPNINKTQITSGSIVAMITFIALAAGIYFIVKAATVEELEESEKLNVFKQIGLENNCTIGELRKHIEDMKYVSCQTLFGKDNATESWQDWLADNDFVEKQIPFILGAIFTLLFGTVFFPFIACTLIFTVCRDRNQNRNEEEGTEMRVIDSTPTVEPMPDLLLIELPNSQPNDESNVLKPITTTTTTTTTCSTDATTVSQITSSQTVLPGTASRLLSDIISTPNQGREDDKATLLKNDDLTPVLDRVELN